MTTDYILDLSVLPNESGVIHYLNTVNLSHNPPILPFWDIRTGNIHTGYLGRTEGVLLLKPTQQSLDLILRYRRDPDKYQNLPKNILNYAITHRLSALADVNDPKIDVNFEKLASQYYFGVFIDREIPLDRFLEMFAVMEMKGNQEMLKVMYHHTTGERLIQLKRNRKTVPPNRYDNYTYYFLHHGVIPDISWRERAHWTDYLILNGQTEIAMQFLNMVTETHFKQMVPVLSEETVRGIMDAMVHGDVLNSQEKHQILKDRLTQ